MAAKKKKAKKLKNRTDRLLSIDDIQDQMPYKNFEYKEHFSSLCDLVPDLENERIRIENAMPELVRKPGFVYAFVLDDKLIKVGSTITPIRERVTSYNCGRKAYRKAGTCSTTNYFVLQSFLNIGRRIKVYAYFPPTLKFKMFGEFALISPVKNVEKKILTELKQKYGKLPVMCTQQ